MQTVTSLSKNEPIYLGETPNGKVIMAEVDLPTSGFRVYFKSGGELPEMLKGVFLNRQYVENIVASYLQSLDNAVEVAQPISHVYKEPVPMQTYTEPKPVAQAPAQPTQEQPKRKRGNPAFIKRDDVPVETKVIHDDENGTVRKMSTPVNEEVEVININYTG
jgi:hypothetical protein